MQKSFGYFQNDGREFVVTEVETPRGLINYMWNHALISGVNQHGGGDGVYKGRAIQYIDRHGRNLMVRDGHRYFYLRDDDGDFWSPGWHPVQEPLDAFSCTHGLGYSLIESSCRGIESGLRMFVPSREPAEIWTVTLKNTRDAAVTLKFFTFVDWLLQGYDIYSDYHSYLTGAYYPELWAVQCANTAVERPHRYFEGFVASDREPSGYDTSRRAFLGPFGLLDRPKAVTAGACRNSDAACEDMVGVLEHTITLAAGEATSFHVFIGASNGMKLTEKILNRLRTAGHIDREFDALKQRRTNMCRKLIVATPDEHTNILMNSWLKQQIQVYADVGSDNGRGFRDAMQLIWAAAAFDLDFTKHMLDESLRHQFQDGHTLRGWLPVDEHHYSDGPVWIAPVVEAYIKESGDDSILHHEIPYFDGGKGTVWDHLLRGLLHATEDTGAHGLVLCHFGDWNDSLTGVGNGGKGESVWTSIGIVFSLKIAIALAERQRYDSITKELQARADELTRAINLNGWDGNWYLRAIDDFGNDVGSHVETEGRIYLLPQVWAIMADIVDDDRRELLYRMIDEHLDSEYGSLTLAPPYTQHNPKIGRLTAMVPGIWENGSPYNHSNGFKVIADCLGGRGDAAWTSYQKAMPDNPYTPSTHSGCEPYVFANQHLGPDNPRRGETQFAWMTGTAGWYYRAMAEWILGVRADYDGLRIDPCLPSAWKECSLERDFRDARYRIRIRNPDGVQKGKLSLSIDGEPLAGNLVPVFADGQTHVVEVLLEP